MLLLLLSLLGPAAATRPPTAAKRPVYPVRSSSVTFWAGDLSCGAGALSSPVREEHPRDAAEIAVYAEGKFARMCTWFPRWLLLSALGIISRELASRQVREYLVPSTLTAIAQPKAKALSVALRKNLDSRVTKVLSGGNFRELSSLSGIVDRVVQAELEELEGTITSVEDLLRNEMTRSIVEVVEAEVGERVVETLETVVQLNETESSGELKALLRAAGKGQDGTVTLDDIYTLVAGEGALRIPEVSLLMQRVPVLKGGQTQQTKLERWSSLAIAPTLGRLQRAGEIARDAVEWSLDPQGGRRRLSAYSRLFNRAAGRDAATTIYEASSTLVDAADEFSSAAASLGQTSEDVLQDVDQVLQSTLYEAGIRAERPDAAPRTRYYAVKPQAAPRLPPPTELYDYSELGQPLPRTMTLEEAYVEVTKSALPSELRQAMEDVPELKGLLEKVLRTRVSDYSETGERNPGGETTALAEKTLKSGLDKALDTVTRIFQSPPDDRPSELGTAEEEAEEGSAEAESRQARPRWPRPWRRRQG